MSSTTGDLVRLAAGAPPQVGRGGQQPGRGPVAHQPAAWAAAQVAVAGDRRSGQPAAVGQGRLEGVELDAQHALLVVVVPGFHVGEVASGGQAVGPAKAAAVFHHPAGEGAGGLIHVLVDEAQGLALEGAGHVAPAVVELVEVVLAAQAVGSRLPREVLVGGAGAGTSDLLR